MRVVNITITRTVDWIDPSSKGSCCAAIHPLQHASYRYSFFAELERFRRVQTKIVIELLFIILLNENAVTFNCYLQILVFPRKCDKIQCFFYRLSAKALQESWMTISLTEDLSGSLVPCYYYWPERYTSLDLKCLLFCFDDGDECFTWLDGGNDIFVCHCDPPFNY